MANKVKAIPDGYHALTPYFTVRAADKAIEFYKQAFGAEEKVRMAGPDGKIMHAELQIGDSVLMLGEESPDMGNRSPQALGGTTGGVMLYCENVDKMLERAIAAGATVKMPAMDMFWGDRYAKIADPFGHDWSIGTHLQDLTPAEIQKGQDEWMKQMAAQKK